MKSTTPRICPHCGATNTGRSLFCAECGGDLNEPPDPTMTRPLGPVTNHAGSGSDQRTEAYAPAWNQSWSGNDPGGANQTGSTPSAPAVRTPVTPVAPTNSTTVSPMLVTPEPKTSSRGFYLGLIAILIIIAIALALGWLALIQPNL